MGEFRWRPDVGGPGVSYKGFWAKGQMDGLGALTFDNGDRFFGTWKMGMKAGEGFYLTADQMDGVTDASDGRVHLKQAICVYDDGSSYTGQIWAPLKGTPALTADRKAAHKVDPIETVDGECHWVPGTNGKAYEFVKPHGKGVIEYPNGERYAGSWSGGRPHGSGMRISRDGSASYGTWDNGNRVPAIDGQ